MSHDICVQLLKRLTFFGSIIFCLCSQGGARADECQDLFDDPLSYSSDNSDRADRVRNCIEVVDEMTKSAYVTTSKMCRNIALTKDFPSVIELPGNLKITPEANATTWDIFIAALGKEKGSRGCRDGILSALAEKAFTNKDAVARLFEKSQLSVSDVLRSATFEVSFGLVNLQAGFEPTMSLLEAHISATSQIAITRMGGINFPHLPFVARLTVKGIIKTDLLGDFEIFPTFDIEGVFTGDLDVPSHRAILQKIDVKSISIRGANLPESILEAFKNIVQQNLEEPGTLAALNRELDARFAAAYAATNPFDFINRL